MVHLSNLYDLRDIIYALNPLCLKVLCQLRLRVAILGHKPQFLCFFLQLHVLCLGGQEIFVKFEGEIYPLLLLALIISGFFRKISHQLMDMYLARPYVPFKHL